MRPSERERGGGGGGEGEREREREGEGERERERDPLVILTRLGQQRRFREVVLYDLKYTRLSRTDVGPGCHIFSGTSKITRCHRMLVYLGYDSIMAGGRTDVCECIIYNLWRLKRQ